jgi:sulfite dehydrogenase (quinone) subunit SoeC
VPALLFIALLATGAQAGSFNALVALLAVGLHVIGMLVERWLFFAEARHAVMNYYGG